MIDNIKDQTKYNIALQLLREIDIDGESTQELLQKLGMEDQMRKQFHEPRLLHRLMCIKEDVKDINELIKEFKLTKCLRNLVDKKGTHTLTYLDNIEIACDLASDESEMWTSCVNIDDAYVSEIIPDQMFSDLDNIMFPDAWISKDNPLEFISSCGTLMVNSDGSVNKKLSDLDDWLLDIEKVDLEELNHYYSLQKLGTPEGGDVLDFGWWNADGAYNKPCRNWRRNTFHKQDLTVREICLAIGEAYEWIKKNRKNIL